MIYTIIRKRQVFYQLANLATDQASISKALAGRKAKVEGKGASSIVPPLKSPEEDKKLETPLIEGEKVFSKLKIFPFE